MENKIFESTEEWEEEMFPQKTRKQRFEENVDDEANVAEILATINIKDLIKKIES